MRFWTVYYPAKHPTLDINLDVAETLSEEQILDEYWEYWKGRMTEVNKTELISKERCIEDWCVTHWAVRNYWREIKDNFE
jgi:hypothetical protein